ncbi:glycosyltransferase [Desulfosporosinus acidiphilus SJ4]|uniref:Glycosyltransferase n=1 Tax=Desulfosporosinus acidiphilus (strain DSM 22704 / JCM 16185 / SJ4) TaxID=646529 RepID=I4DBT4_DESAJ|nr:glycosyltransferase family 4 protein [Desulfosporosinus acidiphilus]AFM43258.1 glycosyltransferase [Desulfosporosinus acidiphilus SJ4]
MKVAIATVQVPFIRGGAEIHAQMLLDALRARGYEADIITIPFKWYPAKTLIDGMVLSQLVDLTEVNGQKIDLLIGTKFPAYYISHPNKVLWLLHQHRQAYELWNTGHGDLHNMESGPEVRQLIIENDNIHLREAKKIFTISTTVTDRLMRYNGIESTPLYPPPMNLEKLEPNNIDDYIFYPSRIDSIKRQLLLVKALKYCKSPVKVVLAGSGDPRYIEQIRKIVREDGTESKLEMLGFISEEEKIRLYSNCLSVYFGPHQEDYGYVTLEAFFSGKSVITHEDSGGPLEFVNNSNGFILNTDPKEIAETIDILYDNKEKARQLGENGSKLMKKLNISWDYVIERLIG